MALTTYVLLRLEGKKFDKLYAAHEDRWVQMAETARTVMAAQVPSGHATVDDIRKILLPMIELDSHLRVFLVSGTRPLTQKYWVSDFTDYVLHRVYEPKLKHKGTSKNG
jgi:hypothetical protein